MGENGTRKMKDALPAALLPAGDREPVLLMLARRRSIPYKLTVSRPNECVAGAAQGPSEQPYTWLANAGRGGAFLGRARSTFERLPAGIRDRNTADRNRLAS